MIKHTGELIVAARKAAKLKQTELAALIGWGSARLSHYETGTREAGVDELVQIAQALEIRLSTLLDGVDRPRSINELTTAELMQAIRETNFTRDETLLLIADLTRKVGPFDSVEQPSDAATEHDERV